MVPLPQRDPNKKLVAFPVNSGTLPTIHPFKSILYAVQKNMRTVEIKINSIWNF